MPVYKTTALLACLLLSIWPGIASAQEQKAAQKQTPDPAKNRHVVVICVDGLPGYLITDPNASLPAIRQLAARGTRAEGMIPSNPSVTWPNHTSLTTGVRPERHGVLFNGVLEKPGLGLPVKVDPRKDKAELIHAVTIYDVLHSKGLTTAAINWPCTRNCSTIQDNFPDVPEALEHTTPALVAELKQIGLMTDDDVKNFAKLSTPAKDRIWTQAACHIIKQRKPNLLLLHPLNVDGVHHKYGPQTSAGYSAVAYADTLVQDVLRAIDEAGLKEQTTILIVSDHGFMSIPKTIQPNVALRKAGLLTVENNQVATARAISVPEGGISMLYLTVPDRRDEDRAKVIEALRNEEGIAEILEPNQFSKYGLPQPTDYPQMADLVLVAKDGYGFGAAATGDELVIKSEATLGTHGFLSTNPKMKATCILSGAGIKPGVTTGVVENIDVPATIARLLNVPFECDGKVIEAALAP